MPGPEVGYLGGPDLFPKTEAEHGELLAWCQSALIAAKAHQQARHDRMRKYHRVARSYIARDTASSWRSAVFIPYTFSVIEAITPRMVAQIPTFVCKPNGPEDVLPAKLMENELRRCAEQVGLFVELIEAVKTSLKYGTGIVKNYYYEDVRKAYEQRPVMQTVMVEQPITNDATGQTLTDLAGAPQTEQVPVEQPVIDPETGQPQMEWVPYEYMAYAGPKSTWVDPFNFWVAPEATDLDDARYTIERMARDQIDIIVKLKEGVYRLPPGVSSIEETFIDEEDIREDELGEGGQRQDATRKPVELHEFHTKDNRVITMMNQKAIIRVAENPFWHGEKPYSIFPDYLQEGEFFGTGEVEAIEGMQDLVNALYNQRIDNLRITMDAMFAVNEKAISDERDLVIRPGGVIRITGDYLPQEALQRIELGDVTSNAFAEAEQLEALIERVSGIGGYQLGQVEEGQNRTATGVSLITEAGSSKFALKVQLMEKVGLRRLARQWGGIIQQFLDEERVIRVMGPNGQWLFPSLTPEAVQGNLDYEIDVASSTLTEQAAMERSLLLFQTLAPVLPQAIPKLAQDVLEAHGKKDFMPYLMGTPDIGMIGQIMQAQQTGGTIIPFPEQGQPGEQGQEQAPTEEQQA